MEDDVQEHEMEETAIAIVGMAGRFPGARDLDEYWRNLAAGVESIEFLDTTELRGRVDPALLADPRYVPAASAISDPDLFDADFFAMSPREAEVMDPQLRLFLETGWHALEDAGEVPARLDGAVGVYAGAGLPYYVRANPGLLESTGSAADLQAMFSNDKDYLATYLSYKLDLEGPSLAVQTACSTSLVAVHLACQSLLDHECDLALAGGVTVRVPHRVGYLHFPGAVYSPDGHCRPFDAGAAGTVFGSGVGIVVLERLADALANGHRIRAVVRGSACNNDGADKVGYTAPSVRGQARCIAEALSVAGVSPQSVSYVECHGTGTALGDPIEVAGLVEGFAAAGGELGPGTCALGSVKSNFGHLEAAAGIAGLIKTVLALENRLLPPSLHFEEPNPRIDFAATPFYVNAAAASWPGDGGPRRAGVSSFGIGGTNAHLVLEEAPPRRPAPPSEGPYVVELSAKTREGLEELSRRWRRRLEPDVRSPEQKVELADLAFTSRAGRARLGHRLAVVAHDEAALDRGLAAYLDGEEDPLLMVGDGKAQIASGEAEAGVGERSERPRLAFVFTGQGAQYPAMGRRLYATEPIFRDALERADEVLGRRDGHRLLEVMGVAGDAEAEATKLLDETAWTQPALFALELALFELWRSFGVEPDFVLGHSLGEYAAACAAGVLDFADALKLVAERARLMQELPAGEGAMASVSADLNTVTAALAPYGAEVSIAALNGAEITISGVAETVERIGAELAEGGARVRPLTVSHAFHSPLMEPILDDLESCAATLEHGVPRYSLISNLSGQEIGAGELDATYWSRHARQPVRFAEGMTTLWQRGVRCFVEIGPRPTLLALGRRAVTALPGQASAAARAGWLASLRKGHDERRQLALAIAGLAVRGVETAPRALVGESRRRVALPLYPFARQRHWREAPLLPENTSPTPPRRTVEPAKLGELRQRIQAALEAANLGPHLDLRLDPANTGGLDVELRLLDDDGAALAMARTDLRLADVPAHRGEEPPWADWLWEIDWREIPWPPPGAMPPTFLPSPKTLSERLAPDFAAAEWRRGEEFQATVLPRLEALATAYAREALAALGFANGSPPAADLAAELGVKAEHRRLLDCLVEMVQGSPDPRSPENAARAAEIQASLAEEYPEVEEVALLGRCGPRLAAVLRGDEDPLEILFPGGSLEVVEKLYRESPFSRVYNHLIRDLVTAALESLPPGRAPRLLEIGGGTGGTTVHLLPALPAAAEYSFTDISPRFVGQAAREFGDRPGFQALTFDVERKPREQGFEDAAYDLVIAANVLHATRDLRQTLDHVAQLLAPGGLLLLLEGTGQQRWVDLVFGLTEGWWRFEDHDLRASYPLVSGDTWRELLEERGFTAPRILPPPESSPLAELQAVIVARRAVPDARASAWRVLGGGAVGEALVERAHAAGQAAERIDDASIVTDGQLIDLRALEPGPPPAAGGELGERAEKLCAEALTAFAASVSSSSAKVNGADSGPRWWIATRGAQPAGEKDAETVDDVAAAALWGLGATAAVENPEQWGGLIDLDPRATPEQDAETLFATLDAAAGGRPAEGQVAWRFAADGVARARVPRLRRTAPGRLATPPVRCDATYLVTGGLGGVGRRVAQWLAENDAGRLVLVGRRGAADEAARRAVEKLASRTTVVVEKVDVTDGAAMQALLERLAADGPPLRGVIHAAGLVEVHDLATATVEDFQRVAAPKIAGAWNLHRLCQGPELDFLVFFSSMTSILPPPGLGAYNAGSAFLDSLAHDRRRRGLPALTVNWGVWHGLGMAAPGAAWQKGREVARGIRPFAAEPALAALGEALTSGRTRIGVARFDAAAFLEELGAAQPPLLEEVVQELRRELSTTSGKDGAAGTSLVGVLLDSPPAERRSRLADLLLRRVAETLGRPRDDVDPERGLFEQGLDSLMALELKSRLDRDLELELPQTLIFNHPNVTALVERLHDELFGAETGPGTSTVTAVASPSAGTEEEIEAALVHEVEELSEAEMVAYIDRELAAHQDDDEETVP